MQDMMNILLFIYLKKIKKNILNNEGKGLILE